MPSHVSLLKALLLTLYLNSDCKSTLTPSIFFLTSTRPVSLHSSLSLRLSSHNSVSCSKNRVFSLSQLFSRSLTLSPSPLSLSVFFFRISLPFLLSVMHQKSLTFVTRVVPETPPTRGPRWNISFLIQLLSAPFRLLSMATVAERASGRQVSSEAQPCLRQMSSPKKERHKEGDTACMKSNDNPETLRFLLRLVWIWMPGHLNMGVVLIWMSITVSDLRSGV